MSLFFFVEVVIALIIEASLPVLAVATAVGVLISIVQVLTQIQEQTLPQIAKIGAVIVVIILYGSTVGEKFVDYMNMIFVAIVAT